MRTKPSVKPSHYPAIPFHIIRITGFIATFIIGIILAVFISNLHSNGYKLPWAFLVLLIAVVLTLLNFIFTTLLHCFHGLSPRLNLTTNSVLLVLWLISLGLLSYSMAHTILTSCTTTYWGTSTGIKVCRIYKALFAFTVLATATHIAAVSLDVIIRRRQTRLGQYDPMASNAALNEYKMHNRGSSVMSGGMGPYHPDDMYAQQHPSQPGPYEYPVGQEAYHDTPPTMPGGYMSPPPSYGGLGNHAIAAGEQDHAYEVENYGDAAAAGDLGAQSRVPRVRYSAYGASASSMGYNRPAEQTGYDAGAYR
ncbi:uncharacterized protein BP01DRAFT_365944 [Aspergillus saccharolyticus JOP 1030-1]|uniref:MARVEL domain-containing protein n=1 Tax=Aspergillus saccharolyticus JOP 1030-1 TaxID=1450539 RepID=A0A318ZEK2_9EURO|nr:hypothetical protein BP01DRAFT_365944 [Aspergillus saccharolyticus JOP 1030-1]PYH45097.1 hypothetical protein BP01DRAFT_365944 [Aspergillus saccharolyticus JOP 1030-1]